MIKLHPEILTPYDKRYKDEESPDFRSIDNVMNIPSFIFNIYLYYDGILIQMILGNRRGVKRFWKEEYY